MKIKPLKEIIDNIKKTNDVFEKATLAQKRVMVAQDCIDRIENNQLIPDRGSFLKPFRNVCTYSEVSVKEVLEMADTTCRVCAKGGLLMSYIGRVNETKVCELSYESNSKNDENHKKLTELFSIEQLSLIEMAFEGSIYIESDYEGNPLNHKDVKNDSYYYTKYQKDGERLKVILDNIIRNKGTFIWDEND